MRILRQLCAECGSTMSPTLDPKVDRYPSIIGWHCTICGNRIDEKATKATITAFDRLVELLPENEEWLLKTGQDDYRRNQLVNAAITLLRDCTLFNSPDLRADQRIVIREEALNAARKVVASMVFYD